MSIDPQQVCDDLCAAVKECCHDFLCECCDCDTAPPCEPMFGWNDEGPPDIFYLSGEPTDPECWNSGEVCLYDDEYAGTATIASRSGTTITFTGSIIWAWGNVAPDFTLLTIAEPPCPPPPPPTALFRVLNAATPCSIANGDYTQNGTYNGHPAYEGGTGWWVWWAPIEPFFGQYGWYISPAKDDISGQYFRYSSSGDLPLPPGTSYDGFGGCRFFAIISYYSFLKLPPVEQPIAYVKKKGVIGINRQALLQKLKSKKKLL